VIFTEKDQTSFLDSVRIGFGFDSKNSGRRFECTGFNSPNPMPAADLIEGR